MTVWAIAAWPSTGGHGASKDSLSSPGEVADGASGAAVTPWAARPLDDLEVLGRDLELGRGDGEQPLARVRRRLLHRPPGRVDDRRSRSSAATGAPWTCLP